MAKSLLHLVIMKSIPLLSANPPVQRMTNVEFTVSSHSAHANDPHR